MKSHQAAEMIDEAVADKMRHLIEDDADLDAEVDVKESWKDLKALYSMRSRGRKLLS